MLTSLVRAVCRLGDRVLIIAHTHSAVDNILVRIADSQERINVLRLGSLDRVDPQLHRFSYEAQIEQIFSKHAASMDSNTEFEAIVQKSNVIGCTAMALSGGVGLRHEALTQLPEAYRFHYVLVDEAGQLSLPMTLGALSCLAPGGKFVLVGDPNQLPPLVQSEQAKYVSTMKEGLDVSLLKHLIALTEESSDVNLGETKNNETKGYLCDLTLQYRMNEPITALVNHVSYQGKLKCADQKTAKSTWSSEQIDSLEDPIYSNKLDHSLVFCVTGCQGTSSCNEKEADLVAKVGSGFISRGVSPDRIGVMAPYRSQCGVLRSKMAVGIEVNTVDQYQGRDKSIVLLSLTRCWAEANNGRTRQSKHLLNDAARLAVALTRPKHKIIIFGCNCSVEPDELSPISRTLHFIREHCPSECIITPIEK
ncbi:Tripartite DNA replication factor [Cichlidogyrus casuarinus]|uniref:DNA replication ATP-dependent helicase/nuclease n=1 Tax=Cichlidogyrus casuarinus TaxID=1844966 RepID=A0ABD2QFK0_9PLAT